MIELSDFLGSLLSQISDARKQADEASIELAELYAQNDFLRILPVPRVRMPEIEITMPVCIKKAKQEKQYSKIRELDTRQIVFHTYKILNNELQKMRLDKNREQIFNRKEYIQINRALFANTNIMREAIKNENNPQEVIWEYISGVKAAFITTKKLKENTRATGTIKNIEQELLQFLDKTLPLEDGKLEKIDFSIESNTIKESQAEPIQLKLSIKEDAFLLVRKDEPILEGDISKSNLNDNVISNYHISRE